MTPYCDEWMDLLLEALPHQKIRSSYRKGRPGFPSRLAFMHPDAVAAFVRMEEACGWRIVLTDAWRASLVSLNRRYPVGKPVRRTTQPPAWSGHNHGFSIDIDVDLTLKLTGWTKRELDVFMEGFGFYCHRRDHRRGSEDWHYNAIVLPGDDWMRHAGRVTSPAVEAMMKAIYGRYWRMTVRQKQRSLKHLKLYPGAIDGVWGGWSKKAAVAFQRAWHLTPDGVVGARTGRLLAFRCAELRNPLVRDLWTVKG